MTMNKKKTIALLLVVALLFSFTACGTNTEEVSKTPTTEPNASSNVPATPEKPKEKPQEPIVIMTGAGQNTLDPYSSGSIVEQNVLLHVAEPLIEFDGNSEILPALATEWRNVEPTVWEFDLREGVKFHDGTPVTAEDIKFNIERIVEKQKNGTLIGNYGWIQASVNFDRVEIVNPSKIRVITVEPVPALLVYLAEVFIMPKAFIESRTDQQLQEEIMGSGPYKFIEWKKDQYIAIERNEDYWGKRPEIQKILFKYAPEASTRVAELATGGAHVIDKVPPDMQGQVKDGAHMVNVASGTRQYMGFVQYANPVIRIKEVRQAINHAVDLDSIIKNLLMGSVERTGTFVNEPWNNPNTTAYTYDVQKSKDLLASAGLVDSDGNGFLEYEGKEVVLKLLSPKGRYIKDIEIAQAIGSDLAKVGLNSEVRVVDWAVFVGQLDSKTIDGDMFLIGSGSAFEGQSDISDVYSTNSSNYGQWNNPEFDALYDKLRTVFDEDERREILNQMQEIMKEDAAMFFMYFQPSFYGVSDKLEWTPRKDARTVLTHAKLLK